MKTYRHRAQGKIRSVDASNGVTIAALEKLGWEEVTAQDIRDEPSLSVTYETVTEARQPAEPPALPKLTTPVPPGPTRDTSEPVTSEDAVEEEPHTSGAAGITREDAKPLTGGKK